MRRLSRVLSGAAHHQPQPLVLSAHELPLSGRGAVMLKVHNWGETGGYAWGRLPSARPRRAIPPYGSVRDFGGEASLLSFHATRT